MGKDALTEFQDYVMKYWPDGQRFSMIDLFIMSTGLGGESGEVLDLLKKSVRNGSEIKPELLLELGDTLHYLTRIAHRFGFTLEQVMQANIDKLNVRHGRV